MTGAILFEDEIKQDGGGDNYSSAVRDAYRQLNMNGLIGSIVVDAINKIETYE